MADKENKSGSLLITRPTKESIKTRDMLLEYGFQNIYIEPMFEIEYLDISYPNTELGQFSLIIATSKHSIIGLANIIPNLMNIPILVVGAETMKTAIDLGFKNVRKAEGTVESLMNCVKYNLSKTLKILYIRGTIITYNLKKILSSKGFIVEELILYKTSSRQAFSLQCQNLILQKKISGVLFYSTRTAEIFSNLIKKRNFTNYLKKVVAYTFSANIAKTLESTLWLNIIKAEQPTQESLIKSIIRNL